MNKIPSTLFYDGLDELVQYLEKRMNETLRFYPNNGYPFEGHPVYLLAKGIFEDSLHLIGLYFEEENKPPRQSSFEREASLLTAGLTEAIDHYFCQGTKQDYFAPDFGVETVNVKMKICAICEKIQKKMAIIVK